MGCGASTQAPQKYSIAHSPPEASKEVPKDVREASSLTTMKTALSTTAGTKEFEAVFSSAGDAEGIADRVSDELTKVGYRLGKGHTALLHAASVVVCLSTDYFSSTPCCADLCTAVEHQMPIIFVVIEGASWNGKPRPEPCDVPDEVIDGGNVLRPCDAFAKAMAKSGGRVLEHSRTYFEAFVEELKTHLGAPEASAQVQEAMNLQRQSANTIRSSLTRADERPVSVTVDLGHGGELSDGGIILVRSEMTLAELRRSLVEEHEEDEEDDEAIKVLGSGSFTFVFVRPGAEQVELSSGGKVVSRDEENQWTVATLGEPIAVLAEVQ